MSDIPTTTMDAFRLLKIHAEKLVAELAAEKEKTKGLQHCPDHGYTLHCFSGHDYQGNETEDCLICTYENELAAEKKRAVRAETACKLLDDICSSALTRVDKVEAAIAMLQDRARRAYKYWDSSDDMKVGKLLSAMGGSTGYDLELDKIMKERE